MEPRLRFFIHNLIKNSNDEFLNKKWKKQVDGCNRGENKYVERLVYNFSFRDGTFLQSSGILGARQVTSLAQIAECKSSSQTLDLYKSMRSRALSGLMSSYEKRILFTIECRYLFKRESKLFIEHNRKPYIPCF